MQKPLHKTEIITKRENCQKVEFILFIKKNGTTEVSTKRKINNKSILENGKANLKSTIFCVIIILNISVIMEIEISTIKTVSGANPSFKKIYDTGKFIIRRPPITD